MAVKTKCAVLFQSPGRWELTEVELAEPRSDELLIRMVATGLCHSDDRMASGYLFAGAHLPMAGGHEGAGVVEQVGKNTSGFAVGDHVVLSFIAACGRCRWCASGMQNLCDRGSILVAGTRPDGTFRMQLDGVDVGQMAGISTFSQYSVVATDSAVKIDKSIPLDLACLVGCGVATGWGAAVNSANTQVGDVVIVMGVGGVGINAVQGAFRAGAQYVIAVDPVEFKRSKALELGATVAFADIESAADFARSVTNGQGADSSIVTIGVVTPEHIGQAFGAIRKAGTCVVVGGVGRAATSIPISPAELTLYQKRLQGSVYGGMSPTKDIPRLLSLYQSGKLKLDELVTRRYALDDINEGFADMHAGTNIRGVVQHTV